MQLIFATNNQNKINEIKRATGANLDILTLKEAGILVEIPEPYNTLEENAATKSKTIYEMTGKNCFSEDTGLEVNALGGAPGVKSARYAGEPANDANNIQKLLLQMQNQADRAAQFRTVISLILENKEYFFEGICTGQIISDTRGDNGFGYDPVFTPDGADKTFAEMSLDEKNIFSHRKKATQKLVDFLNALSAKR